jgi:hypothetical protein
VLELPKHPSVGYALDCMTHFFFFCQIEMTPEELEDDELTIDDSLTPIERISMFVNSNVILHR